MAIASLNVNGVRGRLDEVELLLNNLGIHFLTLNETKLDKNSSKGVIGNSGLPAVPPCLDMQRRRSVSSR